MEMLPRTHDSVDDIARTTGVTTINYHHTGTATAARMPIPKSGHDRRRWAQVPDTAAEDPMSPILARCVFSN
jgi:hypothetical protein